MNTSETNALNRRETLVRSFKGAFLAVVVAPAITQSASCEVIQKREDGFVPENDYPYFGWSPESGSS